MFVYELLCLSYISRICCIVMSIVFQDSLCLISMLHLSMSCSINSQPLHYVWHIQAHFNCLKALNPGSLKATLVIIPPSTIILSPPLSSTLFYHILTRYKTIRINFPSIYPQLEQHLISHQMHPFLFYLPVHNNNSS